MKAGEIHAHFKKLGPWVDWPNTTDGFHFGDAETEVRGIMVAWKPYASALRRAQELGCNFFLAHEAIFQEGRNGNESAAAGLLEQPKLEWLKASGMTVYRCHDVWDLFPGAGVRDRWAAGLGFTGLPLKLDGYYRLEDVAGHTFHSLCAHVAARMKTVRQEAVLAVGDPARKVSRLGLGTGALTKLEKMLELGADVCVVCDDYFRHVRDGALFQDLGVPFIVVNHGAKEEWGMEGLFRHARAAFASIPVHFLPQGCPYRIVG